MSALDDEKLFYQRFWALHRDSQLVSIVKKFGIGVFRRSSVLEGLSELCRDGGFGGNLCVEIGTCKGLTALVLARYFKEVVSIDVQPDEDKHAIAKYCGVTNIHFVDVKDNAEKAAVIKSLQFDGAYVDGDHARDTEADFGLVRRCGRVLFHEYWEAQPAVFALVNALAKGGNVYTKGKLALWTA
jgi:hypothetical protein